MKTYNIYFTNTRNIASIKAIKGFTQEMAVEKLRRQVRSAQNEEIKVTSVEVIHYQMKEGK